MKKEDIDKLIEESLSSEEAEFYHSLDEPGLFKQFVGLYRGKLALWVIWVTIWQLIFTAFAVWAGVKFFRAETTDDFFIWGAIMFIGLLFATFMKLWHWMQMDKNTIIQEIKRMEYQVAILTEKIAEK